jgi:ribulose-5-phosphate 4-epimerase/fuculose-1-phosphate aldolase
MTEVGTTRPRRTVAQERWHRKRQLAAALRLFARYGFDDGVGGHLTARDPEQPDCFWINPFGMYFGQIRVSDLLLVDERGEVRVGEGRVNPAGFAIHSQLHAARPDVIAAAHTHSIHGRAWSTTGRLLGPITQDACVFYETHAVFDQYSGVVEGDEAKLIAEALGGLRAVILANHGLLTVGGSVAEAAWLFISMERCCQVQLLAESVGTPKVIDPAASRAARELLGTPGMARLNFRPLFADIVRTQPDLLD